MSTRILEFQVGGGAKSQLLVEVDDPFDAGNRPVAQAVVEKARQSLEAALSEVTPGVGAIIEHVRKLANKPDEFGLEFGIKFTAEAGALIAKTALEGNIKVSLKWAAT
jgi:hypothetical protein